VWELRNCTRLRPASCITAVSCPNGALDGRKDGKETDVDCGGPSTATGCARCSAGRVCASTSDCVSGLVCGQLDTCIGMCVCLPVYRVLMGFAVCCGVCVCVTDRCNACGRDLPSFPLACGMCVCPSVLLAHWHPDAVTVTAPRDPTVPQYVSASVLLAGSSLSREDIASSSAQAAVAESILDHLVEAGVPVSLQDVVIVSISASNTGRRRQLLVR
jgi:hypothetical protein